MTRRDARDRHPAPDRADAPAFRPETKRHFRDPGSRASLRHGLDALAPVLRLFWNERRRMLLAGAALAALTVLTGMALLGLSGWFLSAAAIAGLSAATALAFDVFMPSAGIRLFTLLRTASRYGERLVTHDATLSVLAALRVRLFLGWARPLAARALAMRPARLLFRLTADIDALDSLYLRVLVPLGAALAAVLAAGVTLGFIDSALGLAVLLLLALGAIAVLGHVWRQSLRPARLRAHAAEAIRARSADLVAGQTDLLMAGRLPAQCEAVLRADACLARSDDRLNLLDTRAGAAFGVLGSIVLSLTLLTAGWLVSLEVIGVPVAVLAVLVALTAAEPLAGLRRGIIELGRTTLAARRVAPQIGGGDSPDDTLSAGADAMAEGSSVPGEPALILSRLHARHDGASRDCLHGISLSVAPGERVALIGASGAGKSSLMAVLAGELPVRAGSARLIRHGWLTQHTELFEDSVRDNLRLADADAGDERLWQALAVAGLADAARTWSGGGLDARLGEGGLGLSGGQARRLALARLLLQDASLWLLDEPTEGLDAQTARDVLRRLKERGAGRTWLMATHLRREASLADRLVMLADGRLTEEWRQGEPGFDAALAGLRPD